MSTLVGHNRTCRVSYVACGEIDAAHTLLGIKANMEYAFALFDIYLYQVLTLA